MNVWLKAVVQEVIDKAVVFVSEHKLTVAVFVAGFVLGCIVG